MSSLLMTQNSYLYAMKHISIPLLLPLVSCLYLFEFLISHGQPQQWTCKPAINGNQLRYRYCWLLITESAFKKSPSNALAHFHIPLWHVWLHRSLCLHVPRQTQILLANFKNFYLPSASTTEVVCWISITILTKSSTTSN